MIRKVVAIIVSYNPDCVLLENVEALEQQVNEIVIIDNGSQSKLILANLEEQYHVKILYMKNNLGIAAGLNIGFKYALDHGYRWVLSMDQDSRPLPDMVSKLIKYYLFLSTYEKVGMIGVNYTQKLGNISGVIEQVTVITSGSLLSTNVFREVGIFKEEYFIDEVDHEYCLRLRMFGYKIYQTREVLMQHNLGIATKHNFFTKTIITYNHNYLRRYYQTRNLIALSKQYFNKEMNFILCRNKFVLKKMIICLIFERDKFRKLFYILKGLIDGIKNKMGKMY